ncbi:MAG: adenylyltransferase, partial [Anaerolineales bacterium]
MKVRRETKTPAADLISPYGGALKDLRVPPEALEEERERASRLPALPLSERAVCDLELLATGGFSPLEGFLGREDYRSVLEKMRLADGTVFSIPVVFHVDRGTELHLDREYALRDSRSELLGVLRADEIYDWDREEFCLRVVGRDDPRHPLVAESHRWGAHCVSGRLRVLALPKHFDFRELRLTPQQARLALAAMGRPNVVAFQTRNPLHRGHEELCQRAAESADATLLLHPVVGLTKPGDVDHYTRVR